MPSGVYDHYRLRGRTKETHSYLIKSEESKELIRIAKLGPKHPNWQGGISKLPYSFDWTETLKKSIRQRDHYTCQLCGRIQRRFEKNFDVHHIDYNKMNCDPKNLITLCRSCNSKVEAKNQRNSWIEFFRLKLEN